MNLHAALEAANRERELNAKALLDTALIVRDLRTAIMQAIEAIDRRSYAAARRELKQALDEMPWPQRNQERE